MGFATGQSRAHLNEAEFPHIAELALPAAGFDNVTRRAMEAFHRSRALQVRFGRRRRVGANEFCRWCFADRADAVAFLQRFEGRLLEDPRLRAKRGHDALLKGSG